MRFITRLGCAAIASLMVASCGLIDTETQQRRITLKASRPESGGNVNQAPVPPMVVTVQAASPEGARDRARTVLEAEGLRIDQDRTGLIVAQRTGELPDAWAECPRVRVTSFESDGGLRRRRFGDPLERITDIEIRFADAGASSIEVAGSHSEEQRNSFTGRHFMVDCLSTGVLENRIATAIEG
ncbi:MAG: hypothetical protein ACFB6S_12785 [Geminicoccaceae bacterium]